jgi:hypothetical protein
MDCRIWRHSRIGQARLPSLRIEWPPAGIGTANQPDATEAPASACPLFQLGIVVRAK